jgi:hypothetical protein
MIPEAPSPANLVVNGGFETGDFTGWSQYGIGYVTQVSSGNPHTGNYAFIVGNAYGTLTQTLNTVVGQTYDVSYWMASDMGSSSISLNGTGVADSLFYVGPYEQITGTYTATSTSTTLELAVDSGYIPNDATWVDDISVTPSSQTPPPPTLLVTLAGGLMGTLHLARARLRRKVA